MIRTGIHSEAYFGPLDYKEGLKQMAEHGYQSVDLNLAGKPIDKYSNDEYLNYLKDLKKAGDDNGIEFFQAHGNASTVDMVNDIRINDFIERQFLTCEKLGCKYIVFHPYTDGYILNAFSHDEIFERNVELFTKLLPSAKNHGVTMCLENLPFRWFEMCRVTEVKKLIKAVNDDNLKACFDTGHANVMHEDIYKSVKLLGDDLKVLHVHDNYGGADDRHYFPFRGNIDWAQFVQALNEIGYKGVMNLETQVAIETPEPMRNEIRKGVFGIAKYLAEGVK